jgi:23S rRNA (pseudouridine1915-N3)-methyltransferase
VRLLIAAVGRLKSGPERELCERYLGRARDAGRALQFAPIDVAEIVESSARRPADRMAEEAKGLLAAVPAAGRKVVLDARGKTLSSEDFAKRLAGWRDQGAATATFFIGGADGLDDSVRRAADLSIAYGAATFPHQLVRTLLAEQIYRSITILAGHPYHRG